jgi:DNA mismatch endonuclease (patch repair protein)
MDRSENMRAIRSKDTKPEKTVRSMLHRLGYRFRLHRPDMPGKPDLVFPSRRKVVFVNGCFWHMHDACKGKRAPSTNTEFWQAKRQRTVDRDRRTLEALKSDGWETYVVWECALRDLEAVQARLVKFLSGGPRTSAATGDPTQPRHRIKTPAARSGRARSNNH